jgi:hypothetical protein
MKTIEEAAAEYEAEREKALAKADELGKLIWEKIIWEMMTLNGVEMPDAGEPMPREMAFLITEAAFRLIENAHRHTIIPEQMMIPAMLHRATEAMNEIYPNLEMEGQVFTDVDEAQAHLDSIKDEDDDGDLRRETLQ